MVAEINLKEIERKAWTSYFQDGLWDIYGGFLLLGFGLMMITDQLYTFLICITLGMVALFARKRIISSHIGYVKFSPSRQARTRRSRIIAIASGICILLLGLALLILVSTNNVPLWLDTLLHGYFLILFGVMLAILVSLAAYMIGVKRYYIYAALVFIAYSIAEFLSVHHGGLPVVIAGGVILLVGLVVLIRFLRKYPKPPEEMTGSHD